MVGLIDQNTVGARVRVGQDMGTIRYTGNVIFKNFLFHLTETKIYWLLILCFWLLLRWKDMKECGLVSNGTIQRADDIMERLMDIITLKQSEYHLPSVQCPWEKLISLLIRIAQFFA